MKELSVWRTCNKIRAAANRINLNIWKYFVPFDIQQNNLISESDFISVLLGPLGRLIGLSNQEVCELADYFRTQDGRIFYVQFCSVIDEEIPNFKDNIPWTSGEEWEDALHTNCLSLTEERKLEIIMTKIATVINKKRHILRPYFQDYELISKNYGVVTFAHFGRVLHFLNINLAPEEMNLLIKKFAKDSYTVNYVAFIETIDNIQNFLKEHDIPSKEADCSNDFQKKIRSLEIPKLPRPEIGKIKTACVFPQQLHFLTIDTSSKRIRDVQEIMLRLQEHIFKHQIRVSEYFKDYDIFNVGRITENQFERGLDALRQSPIGKCYLAKEEIDKLIAFYKDPNDMERICWRTFEDDLDKVFTVKQLHKHPNCKVTSPSVEVKMLPRKGYREWQCAETMSKEATEKLYKKTMQKLIYRLKERRFSLRKYFQEYDKNNRGHVSRAQLRRAFAAAAIPLTSDEILSLEYMYNNDIGFHYFDFINKLEQILNESPLSGKKRGENKIDVTQPPEKGSAPEEIDIDLVLAKIKAKVVCNGIKANEFLRRFDKRNEKIVTRSEFYRGLDQLNCHLTCTEVNTLMDHFTSLSRPDCIDYWKFSEVVESAMAQGHLEKSPQIDPCRHVPSGATPRTFLNFDERQILMRTLNKLSSYVDNNLEEVFKDFDKQTNTGTVTKNQLIRVLNVRKISTVIAAHELDVIFKCFAVGHVKIEPKFNYRSFLNALYIIRENKKISPF